MGNNLFYRIWLWIIGEKKEETTIDQKIDRAKIEEAQEWINAVNKKFGFGLQLEDKKEAIEHGGKRISN